MSALTVGLVAAQAQTATTATTAAGGQNAPALSQTEQTIHDIKNPAPWFTWGGDLRVRNEYQNNNTSLSDTAPRHEQDAFRFRGSVWAGISPVTDLTLNTRLAAEPRDFMKPSNAGTFPNKEGMEWRYGILDSLNGQWRNILDQPMTLTVGRQDILLGDKGNWWLVGDGTPRDGSWTYFLDAARLTFDLKEAKTKVDVIGLYQNAKPGAWMPTINTSSGYYLTEQNETGGILYVSNKSLEKTQIDGYFMYKGDNAQIANGDSGDIYTVGLKVTGDPAEHWRYSVEGAYQFGNKSYPNLPDPIPSQSLSAYGVNSRLIYLFKDKMDDQLRFTFEILSGDDAGTTGQNEGFDILWGRYPRWSELYVNSFNNEPAAHGRPGQMQNIARFGPGWSITPVKDLTFSLDYNAMFAPQSISPEQNPLFAGGDFRGHYLQAILKYKFSEHMTGHLWGEFVFPGDFYSHEPVYLFLRAELMFML
jgi:hypothetical protein